MKLKLSKKEKIDLFKAWGAISIAFAILFGGLESFSSFMISFLIAALTVGIGFIAHELSHKIVAQKFGCWAEFRSFDQMLVLAILVSFFGFVIAAPGGVMIKGHITKKQNGKISSAGIIANLVIALGFMLLGFAAFNPIMQKISAYGIFINSLLALFNLIPIMNFDGRKVLQWNRVFYSILVAIAFVLTFFGNKVVFG